MTSFFLSGRHKRRFCVSSSSCYTRPWGGIFPELKKKCVLFCIEIIPYSEDIVINAIFMGWTVPACLYSSRNLDKRTQQSLAVQAALIIISSYWVVGCGFDWLDIGWLRWPRPCVRVWNLPPPPQNKNEKKKTPSRFKWFSFACNSFHTHGFPSVNISLHFAVSPSDILSVGIISISRPHRKTSLTDYK